MSKVARNTAIFSIATGLSRIAGLIREVVARSYFGTTGPMSAFTLAFQVPNLVRSLFADAALSAAFVPVFTEMLEAGDRKGAAKLASTLLTIIVAVLGAITVVFIAAAGLIMPLFTSSKFDASLTHLTIGLSQALFPIVLLLGVNGLVVGILNAHDHFSIPALSPLVWNFLIIGCLVVLKPHFHGQDQLYAYAIGVVAGTVAQLAMALPVLARIDIRLRIDFDYKDPRVRQVFTLMLPITAALGIINIDVLLNQVIGGLVSDQTPTAIDAAFRLYMLPQGMFSVALATVLFPALSRFAARSDFDGLRATAASGTRNIYMLLVPSAVFMAVLAHPITRLIYERGNFNDHSTHIVGVALFWFCFSLPFSGVNLLLTRSFFSLQRPWIPTALSAGNIVVNAIVSIALYKPFGIAGPVIGTAVSSFAMTVAQSVYLARLLDGDLQTPKTLGVLGQIVLGSAILGVTSYGVWYMLDYSLGDHLIAEVISIGLAGTAGFCFYCALMLRLRVAEAEQIFWFIMRRVKGRAAA